MRGENLALMDIFSRTICSFQNLKSIVDAYVSDRVLQDVTRSTRLQELCLGLQFYQPENQPPSKISLCNLRRLVLRVPDLDQLIGLLRPGHQKFATLIESLFAGLTMYSRKSTLNELHLIHSFIPYVPTPYLPHPSTRAHHPVSKSHLPRR
ncbi:hypothetical protein EV363DRAFT_1349168 [Boletus edulis]|nr:hypothetical protein EV363DRAFT_1349168 [Boletus edulis]